MRHALDEIKKLRCKLFGCFIIMQYAPLVSMDQVTLQFLNRKHEIKAERQTDAQMLKKYSDTCGNFLQDLKDHGDVNPAIQFPLSEVTLKTWEITTSLWKLLDRNEDDKVERHLSALPVDVMVRVANSLEYLQEKQLLGFVVSHIAKSILLNPRDGFSDAVQRIKPRLQFKVAHDILPEFITFDQRKLRTWSLRTSNSSSAQSLSISSDGSMIVFCNKKSISLWNSKKVFKKKWSTIFNCASWSFDDLFLALACESDDTYSVVVFGMNDKWEGEVHFKITCIAPSPIGHKMIFLGDKHFVLYNLLTREIEWEVTRLADSWLGATWSPTGQSIALMSKHEISITNLTDPTSKIYLRYSGEIGLLQWSPDGKQIAFVDTISEGGKVVYTVRVRDLETLQDVFERSYDKPIVSLNWLLDGLYVTQKNRDGLFIYNTSTDRAVPVHKSCQSATQIQWSRDEKHSIYNVKNKALQRAHKIELSHSLTIAQATVLLKKVQGQRLKKFTNDAGERVDERALFKQLDPELKKHVS